jgi:TRAP-type C4-dicarboxylate transport system permease small subunit
VIGLIERIDRLAYQSERRTVAAMMLAMGAIVFLDVAYRVSRTQTTLAQALESGRVADLVNALLANPVAIVVGGTLLGGLAFRTRGDSTPWLRGLALGAGAAGAQWALLVVFPNGLVWAQTVALALTLWLGLIGACLAAYDRRHLALDVGSKLWPEAWRPRVAAVGHAVTALFCLGILYLSLFSIRDHYDTWASSDHHGGTLTGLDVPKWAVFLAIPVAMLVLAARFGLEAAKTWLGLETDLGDETLHQLGIKAEDRS